MEVVNKINIVVKEIFMISLEVMDAFEKKFLYFIIYE